MHWIIQSNLIHTGSYKELLDTLVNKSIPFTVVKLSSDKKKILPYDFSLAMNEDEEYIDFNHPHNIVLGTHDLVLIAQEKAWIPGAFLNANFEHEIILKHWGQHLLNFDGQIKKIRDIKEFNGTYFIRPTNDSKPFDGLIVNFDEFTNWKEKIDGISSGTKILVSPVKEILSEYRLFIVDGKIITGSQYRKNNHIVYNPIIPNETLYFATSMLQLWQPTKAFTLDIALTPDGYKIIEINCINSSDFFASDMAKVVNAIEMLEY
jgi:ATP-grasp domain, R2K clade family 3